MIIAASILNVDFLRLAKEIESVQNAGVDAIHLDVMDGHFVPNLSFGIPILKAIKPKLVVPVLSHLMVNEPEKMIDKFLPDSDGVIIHIEATKNIKACMQAIKTGNKLAGIAINPDTSVDQVEPHINNVYEILLMSVYPGFGGQKFIPETIGKLKKLRQLIHHNKSKALIAVDGGVGIENAYSLYQAGADILVAGTAIFKSKDYAETIRKMKLT